MNKSLNCAAALVSAALATISAKAADRVLGIDVSSAQGTINWADVYANGVVFAYAQATSGTVGVDSDFVYNMTHGKAAGVQMGAYEISHPYVDTPSQEATHFWNVAGPYLLADGKSLSPAIDFEIFSGHDGASSYTAWFNAWAADVKAKSSSFMHPVIYVAPCTGACDLTTNISLAAWIVSFNGEDPYTGSPWGPCLACNAWDPDSTGGWTYWQFADTGAVGGISGDVDLDVYNGSVAALKAAEGIGGTLAGD